jgi:hypothetical protein
VDYHDRWIDADSDGLRVRGYYFPWGTKRIPYESIRAVRRVNTGLLTGRGRAWGTSNPTLWASLDPGRVRKHEALILDLGRSVRPFLTPDDPDAVLAAIREHAPLTPVTSGGRGVVV